MKFSINGVLQVTGEVRLSRQSVSKIRPRKPQWGPVAALKMSAFQRFQIAAAAERPPGRRQLQKEATNMGDAQLPLRKQ